MCYNHGTQFFSMIDQRLIRSTCCFLTELLSELLPGLQSHLDSALNPVRTLGMVVGESVTAAIDPHGQKLSFQVGEVSVVYIFLFTQSTLILTVPGKLSSGLLKVLSTLPWQTCLI